MTVLGRPRVYATHAEKIRAYRQRQKARLAYPSLPAGPFRVLYADPPWQYRDTNPHYHGHARDRYPTLSIAELCALPVRKLAAPKAVLFLWVTNPLLPECFPVLKAWGFTYKTNIAWDKMKRQWGYYVGGQHELLLLATHGSCQPDIQDLPPSVLRIPPGEHSVKPEAFRLLIDALYPEGRRLEQFARERVQGWEAWGNDAALGEEWP